MSDLRCGYRGLQIAIRIHLDIVYRIGQASEGRPFKIHVIQPTGKVVAFSHCRSTSVYDVGIAGMSIEPAVELIFLPTQTHDISPGFLSLNLDSKPLSYLLAISPVSGLDNTYVFNFSLVADSRKEVDNSLLTSLL
jgi:hypothetical protein